MKRRISLFLAIIILYSSSHVFAETIWENKETEKLARSISHEHIERFTTSGWLNLNVVRIDTRDRANEILPIFSKAGISKRDSLKNLIQDNDVLAAVNGSFFNKDSTVINTMIKDGKIISSAGIKDQIPSLIMGADGSFRIGNNSIPIGYTNMSQGYSIDSIPYNRFNYANSSPISILDSNYSPMSIGKKYGQRTLEVLVRNGIVQELRDNLPPVQIPQDGFVITGVDESISSRGLDRIMVGDYINLQFNDPSIDFIKNSISGGTIILENGQVVQKGINSPGKHPRTAAGINSDGSELILLTVDGRHSSFKGVDLNSLGIIMRDLGAYNAINFDGGGSTNLGIKAKGEPSAAIVNIPSQKNRQVINGLAVRNTSTELGPLTSLKVNMKDTFFLYVGGNIEVVGYDENMNKIALAPEEISFSLSGIEGEFQGLKFTPKTEGDGAIRVSARGVSEEVPVRVIGSIQDISADVKVLNLRPGQRVEIPNFTVMDVNGYTGELSPEDLGLRVYGQIGEIQEGKYFQAGMVEKRGAISATFGQGLENIIVNVGSVKKPFNLFTQGNTSVSKHPATVNAGLSIVDNMAVLSYDFSTSDQTRAAYVEFTNPIKIPSGAISLGMNVVSDGKGAWLRGLIVDDKGNEKTIDFERSLSTPGDIYVEASIPQGNYSLKRIYPVETEAQNKYGGQLTFKNFTINYPHNSPVPDLPEATSPTDPKKSNERLENSYDIAIMSEPLVKNKKLKFGSHQKYANTVKTDHVVSFNGFSDAYKKALGTRKTYSGNSGFKLYSLPHTCLLTLSASKGTLWETNVNQWREIKNLVNRPEKNILICLDTKVFGKDSLSDRMEANLFHKFMKDLKKTGKNVLVVEKSKTNYSALRDGVRYLQVNMNHINQNSDFKAISNLIININENDFRFRYDKPF